MAIGWTRKQADRIIKSVQATESSYQRDQRGRTPFVYWNLGVQRAKCTTAIPAGTWASPSSTGAVQLYALDDAGAWEASGDPVQCFNAFASGDDVAVDATCLVAWISGQIWLVNADCGS